MYEEYKQLINVMGYSQAPAGFLTLIVILSIWALVWKGIALWKSGRNNQLAWFVAVLLVNSFGILPIVYILFFQKKRK